MKLKFDLAYFESNDIFGFYSIVERLRKFPSAFVLDLIIFDWHRGRVMEEHSTRNASIATIAARTWLEAPSSQGESIFSVDSVGARRSLTN